MFYLAVTPYVGGGQQVAVHCDDKQYCAAGTLVVIVPQRGRETLEARTKRAKALVDLLNKGATCVSP